MIVEIIHRFRAWPHEFRVISVPPADASSSGSRGGHRMYSSTSSEVSSLRRIQPSPTGSLCLQMQRRSNKCICFEENYVHLFPMGLEVGKVSLMTAPSTEAVFVSLGRKRLFPHVVELQLYKGQIWPVHNSQFHLRRIGIVPITVPVRLTTMTNLSRSKSQKCRKHRNVDLFTHCSRPLHESTSFIDAVAREAFENRVCVVHFFHGGRLWVKST